MQSNGLGVSSVAAAEQPEPTQPTSVLVATSERSEPAAVTKHPLDARTAYGVIVPSPSELLLEPETLESQRETLFERLETELGLSGEQLVRVRQVFEGSAILSQGNPRLSVHPIGRAECRAVSAERPLRPGDAVCGAPNMAALYDAATEGPEAANVCIDQFEFPNIPCEFPVVHVSAREAAQLCEAEDKRLCDAHEWEGACAGALGSPGTEYSFGLVRHTMRQVHNAARSRVWAYGPEKNHALCATSSYKTVGCPGSGFASCGSNTFPTGAFPDCVSPFGVYDLHGNAAEHMNLASVRSELSSAGGMGATEMKGSWFIFSHYEAHEDDCHWRAPDWHATKVMDPRSHSNYHLGFRCCKSIEPGATRATEGQAQEVVSEGPARRQVPWSFRAPRRAFEWNED